MLRWSSAVADKKLEAILDQVPASAFAAAIVRVLAQLRRNGRDELAEKILARLWLQVSPALAEAILQHGGRGRFACAAVLLESYFQHRGNWQRMESELFGRTCKNSRNPIKRAQLITTLAELIQAGADNLGEDGLL
jgi:hypothetical protein